MTGPILPCANRSRATGRSLRVLVGLAVLALPLPVVADEPPLPPADYQRTEPDGTAIAANVLHGHVLIDPVVGVAPWYIGGWQRNVLVGPGGISALVLPDGGNLATEDDLAYGYLSFHRPSGQSSAIYLTDLFDPGAAPATASHREWLFGSRVEDGAYVLDVPGGEVRIDARTGAVLASPRGPVPQANEAIAGVAGLADAACLTYDRLRANLTSLGPPEPLPDLPAPYANGCVMGLATDTADELVVLPEGVAPQAADMANPFYAGRDPLWGVVPMGETLPDAAAVTLTFYRHIGGSGDEILDTRWDEAQTIGAREDGTGIWGYRTLVLEGLDDQRAKAAMASLDPLWARTGELDFARARERSDLATLPDGRHHLADVPGDAGSEAMVFDKEGSRLRGYSYLIDAGYFGCFDVTLETADAGAGDFGSADEGTGDGWQVERAALADFDSGETLRPRSPGARAATEAEPSFQQTGASCMAALGLEPLVFD